MSFWRKKVWMSMVVEISTGCDSGIRTVSGLQAASRQETKLQGVTEFDSLKAASRAVSANRKGSSEAFLLGRVPAVTS